MHDRKPIISAAQRRRMARRIERIIGHLLDRMERREARQRRDSVNASEAWRYCASSTCRRGCACRGRDSEACPWFASFAWAKGRRRSLPSDDAVRREMESAAARTTAGGRKRSAATRRGGTRST